MTAVVDILKIRLLKMKNPKNSYNSGGEKKEMKKNQVSLCFMIARNVITMDRKHEMINSFS